MECTDEDGYICWICHKIVENYPLLRVKSRYCGLAAMGK